MKSHVRFDNKISFKAEMDVDEVFGDLRRCSKCILPETFPGIEFDEGGVCNYCRTYEPVRVFGEDELMKMMDKYRNNGGKYDCIVPISGGRDSAFTLHQMVKKYGMRVLALTVDSGFTEPEGHRNIKRVTEVLNVDHMYLRNEKRIETANKNIKIKFHAWLKKPSINTIVPVLNAADKTMNLQMYKYAHEHKIPLILGGNNVGNSSFEQEHFKTGFLGVFPDDRGRYSTFGKIKLSFLLWLEYLKNYRNFHWSVFKEYAEGAYVYLFESLSKPKDVTALGFYDYIYWNEKEVLSTIQNELDWKRASDTTATWRVDDSAYPLIDYIYYKLVGFTEFDEFYSKLVREGQISRDEALTRCVSDNIPRAQRLEKIFEELEVTREQVDKALEKYKVRLLRKILKRKNIDMLNTSRSKKTVFEDVPLLIALVNKLVKLNDSGKK